MADEDSFSPGELTPETCILRLFRCMNDAEQEELIKDALRTLGERCSFDGRYARYLPEAVEQELQDPDLDGRLMNVWPADWPGQKIVELDNVGDAGDWLEQTIAESISDALFGMAWNDEELAASMAEDYLSVIRGRGFPLPSDFGDDPPGAGWSEEDEEQVRAEFIAFLKHWRKQVLVTIEKQNRRSQ